MAKVATQWASRDGSSTVTAVSGNLLLETGDHVLQQSGFYLVLEGSIFTPKAPTLWADSGTRNRTTWVADDGSSSVNTNNTSVQRTMQDATVRFTQDGTTRILQENVITPKAPTVWADS